MITNEHLAAYRRDGFVAVPGFLDPRLVERMTAWVDEVSAWPDSADAWLHHREATPAGDRLSRSENFVPYHEGLRELLTTGSIVEAASALLEEPAVLYKEKINYKHPGGGGYAAHQDAPAYEFVTRHVTCLVAVDAATVANGCLSFAPGRHAEGLIALDAHGCIAADAAASMAWQPAELEPGDALFFSSFAPHHSPPNTTDVPRRALYLTYNARSEGDHRDRYYADKREAFAKARAAGGDTAGYISKIGHFQGTTVTQ